ncbi:MAG: hypothetical protein IT292_04545 [Deltaproteobacteria bacterium]|nr:hypothetical protein [Deltaproteobacteria bacterium]
MQKLSEAIKDIVENNTLLQMGMHQRLLNLSQLGRFILPMIKARTEKTVQTSAIVMGLSRLQSDFKGHDNFADLEFAISNMTVHSDLLAVTWPNTKEVRQIINTLHGRVAKSGGYFTVSQGIHEITVILDAAEYKAAKALATEKPVSVHPNLGSIGITLKQNYLDTPGLFFLMFQQLYFQNINIIEIASTANELILYVNKADVKLTFETVYNRFIQTVE